MDNTILELANYCLGFYGDGEDSLKYFESWGHEPMKLREILAVLPHVEEVYPNEIHNGVPVNVDSFVRELVRDFVLAGRGVEFVPEYFITVEGKKIFQENADAWREQIEDLKSPGTMTGAEINKAWEKISAPSNIKPKWFGFLKQ